VCGSVRRALIVDLRGAPFVLRLITVLPEEDQCPEEDTVILARDRARYHTDGAVRGLKGIKWTVDWQHFLLVSNHLEQCWRKSDLLKRRRGERVQLADIEDGVEFPVAMMQLQKRKSPIWAEPCLAIDEF